MGSRGLLRGARQLAALAVAFCMAGAWCAAPAQDMDPFAEPAPTATPAPAPGADPFAAPGSADPGPNPFDLPPTPAPTPAPGDPFSAGPAAPDAENPFAVPAAKAPNPFDDEAPVPVAATPAPAAGPATVARGEVRAVMVLSGDTGFQSAEQIAQLARDCRDAGITRVYIEARTAFGVAYASRIERPLPFISPTFDNPVAELRRALAPGTEIFAVVTVLPSYSALIGSRPPASHVFGRHPGYMAQSVAEAQVAPDNRIHLDPGNPEAMAYLRTVLEELDAALLPDGYLLADVGYPGVEWGYSPDAVARFRGAVGGQGNPVVGDPTWAAWRRARVADLVVDVRDSLRRARPGVRVSLLVPTDGPPPASWGQYLESPAYAQRMVDWLPWCQDGLLDEVVLEVHERISPQGNVIEDWVAFLNRNRGTTLGLVSIAGGQNFLQGVTRQFSAVRSRGLGTVLYHYANPVRGSSRGLFAGFPNTLYSGAAGRPVPGEPLRGDREARQFDLMASPPPEAPSTRSTPVVLSNPLENRPLRFSTPTPIPTPMQEQAFVPPAITRRIVLTSGKEMEAVVTRVTDSSITLEPPGAGAVVISRSAVARIEPGL